MRGISLALNFFRNIDNAREMEAKILEMGKKAQVCVSEKENRKKIIDAFMCHLKWHPLTHLGISFMEAESINVKEVWQDHVQEMHTLCKDLDEAWAWEYLWKSWYTLR
jgi:hypothetical protein